MEQQTRVCLAENHVAHVHASDEPFVVLTLCHCIDDSLSKRQEVQRVVDVRDLFDFLSSVDVYVLGCDSHDRRVEVLDDFVAL